MTDSDLSCSEVGLFRLRPLSLPVWSPTSLPGGVGPCDRGRSTSGVTAARGDACRRSARSSITSFFIMDMVVESTLSVFRESASADSEL